VLRTIIDGEIAPGLARLRVSSKELLAESDLYPWVGEYPEVYEPLPLGVMFRARAVELMDYLVRDASFSPIQDLDERIAELREVLPSAAAKPPSPAVARQLKEVAKEKAA
jgi:hypothetical protein